MATSADRLYEILSIRKMRQTDLINACKPICDKYGLAHISKPRMSEWMHGKCSPSQKYLTVIGETLNVSEAWLIGLDVPMERKTTSTQAREEYVLLEKFNRLSYENKNTIMKLMDSLLTTQ